MQKIIKNLNGKEFYKKVFDIVQNGYTFQKEEEKTEYKVTREEIIKLIHDFAENQITAEGNGAFDVLMTDSIQNLIRKYKNSIPNTVWGQKDRERHFYTEKY